MAMKYHANLETLNTCKHFQILPSLPLCFGLKYNNESISEATATAEERNTHSKNVNK